MIHNQLVFKTLLKFIDHFLCLFNYCHAILNLWNSFLNSICNVNVSNEINKLVSYIQYNMNTRSYIKILVYMPYQYKFNIRNITFLTENDIIYIIMQVMYNGHIGFTLFKYCCIIVREKILLLFCLAPIKFQIKPRSTFLTKHQYILL